MLFSFGILFGVSYLGWQKISQTQASKPANLPAENLRFLRTNHQGIETTDGVNYVVIFDPKSPALDFKVSVGLAHPLYTKTSDGTQAKEYVPKRFREIIADENAKLNGKSPIVAINADYIDSSNNPQGLNISRGWDYAGEFQAQRSSFGISGGVPSQRQATIQIGKRTEPNLNFNVVGGNGRFYRNGKFKDICQDLGTYACKQETQRSLVAITAKGYVILLVNNQKAQQANDPQVLYPNQFDKVLSGIATQFKLGQIQEGMLFDGGQSAGLAVNGKIEVENQNSIGSVFLIYQQ
jgi:hypothetical protein